MFYVYRDLTGSEYGSGTLVSCHWDLEDAEIAAEWTLYERIGGRLTVIDPEAPLQYMPDGERAYADSRVRAIYEWKPGSDGCAIGTRRKFRSDISDWIPIHREIGLDIRKGSRAWKQVCAEFSGMLREQITGAVESNLTHMESFGQACVPGCPCRVACEPDPEDPEWCNAHEDQC